MFAPMRLMKAAAVLGVMAVGAAIWLAPRPDVRRAAAVEAPLRTRFSPLDEGLDAIQRAAEAGAKPGELTAMRISARRLLASGECAAIDAAEGAVFQTEAGRYRAEGVFVLACGDKRTFFAVQGDQPIRCGDALTMCPAGSWRPGAQLDHPPQG